MSYLGDLIVDKGPYMAGDLIPEPLRYPAAAQMNALRDELIELRRRDDTAPEAAPESTESAEQPSAQGEDGNGPETGTAGATDERAREDT